MYVTGVRDRGWWAEKSALPVDICPHSRSVPMSQQVPEAAEVGGSESPEPSSRASEEAGGQ